NGSHARPQGQPAVEGLDADPGRCDRAQARPDRVAILPRIGDARRTPAGRDRGAALDHDETMLRKLIASGLVVATMLIAVPTVLGALRSQSAFAAPFAQGDLITGGWSYPQSVEAPQLKLGGPCREPPTRGNA